MNVTTKHTPGPWHVTPGNQNSGWAVEIEGGQLLVGGAGLQSLANARLIAAAPELLAALSVAKEALLLEGNSYVADVIATSIKKADGFSCPKCSTPDDCKELGCAGVALAEEDAFVIQRMGSLLAQIAVAIRGPEPARRRWGYTDLPERVAELVAFKKAVLDPENQPSQFGTTLMDVEWQPIETAPKDRIVLLLVGETVHAGCWYLADTLTKGNGVGDSLYPWMVFDPAVQAGINAYMAERPTKWRELPAAPATKEPA